MRKEGPQGCNVNCTNIIAWNCNGFPSNRANRHKLKDFNELMKGNNVLIALETGINSNNRPKIISDEHILARINH